MFPGPFTITTLLTLITSGASAAALEACNETPLLPWVVSRATIFQPTNVTQAGAASRAGSLNFNITDFNWLKAGHTPTGTALFEATTTNCTATWTRDFKELYGTVLNCSETVHGNWTFQILGGNAPSENAPLSSLTIAFTRINYERLPGRHAKKAFEGSKLIALDAYLERTGDNRGGYWLRLKDNKQVNIAQNMYECLGICENFVSNYTGGVV